MKEAAKSPIVDNVIPKAMIVNISSSLGSVELLNKNSFYYTYRMSKVQNNMNLFLWTGIKSIGIRYHGIDKKTLT